MPNYGDWVEIKKAVPKRLICFENKMFRHYLLKKTIDTYSSTLSPGARMTTLLVGSQRALNAFGSCLTGGKVL